MNPIRTRIAAVTLLIPFALGGCVEQNHRLTSGPHSSSTRFAAEALAPAKPGMLSGDDAVVRRDAEPWPAFPEGMPSVTSLDRADWPTTTVVVPVDGTGHRPTYRLGIGPHGGALPDLTARQRLERPTAITALETTGEWTGDHALEALANPFIAFGSAVIIPVRLIIHPQTRVEYAPDWSYDRYPSSRLQATPPQAASSEPVGSPADATTPSTSGAEE
jgi:hypothetical protein